MGGNLTQLRKRHIYNTQLGENWRGQVPPQSPVALLLLFTTVTKILHSLTQTLLIVDALVCWSYQKHGHKARECSKKRGTVYVPCYFLHQTSLEKNVLNQLQVSIYLYANLLKVFYSNRTDFSLFNYLHLDS